MPASSSRFARYALGIAMLAAVTAVSGGAQQTAPPVTVLGRAVDSLSHPIASADVSISALHLSTVTDAFGRFRLGAVPAGPHVVSIRKVGYGPVDVAIQTPRDTSLAPVIMVPGAVVLRTVVTRTVGMFGKPARLAYTSKYDGFYERRAYSAGSGRFYTREDIDRMGVQDFKDLLRRVPHLQMWDDGGNTVLRFATCPTGGIMIRLNGMQVWPLASQQDSMAILARLPAEQMDGNVGPNPSAADPLEVFRTMNASDVEAIEVYPSSSSLPVEAVGNACAAIFVWTR